MTISDMSFDDGGMVPQSVDPGQGQEGGIPMSGAAQPAAATPQQRLASAGSMVQSLLAHGMRKHNLIGPDGKPMRVGAYAGGGLVRSFADGGFVDAQNEPQGEAAADAGDGGSGPETTGAIPSSGGGQDYGLSAQLPASGSPPGSMQGPNSFASTGSAAPPSLMQYVTGADAPPDQVMDQVHAAFKRPGMPGSKAALAAVAAAGEKSPDLGFSVLQGYRKRYDRARAEAGKAFDMGNLDGGVAALNDAYSNFPTDESAAFSHDGNKIHATINGLPLQLEPRMASELIAKGVGGHFDNQAFTGLSQPFSTIGAISNAADKMAAQQYPGRTNSQNVRTSAPQGTQVAAARGYGSNARDVPHPERNHTGDEQSDRANFDKRVVHMQTKPATPAEYEENYQQDREARGKPRTRPSPPPPPEEPPKPPGLLERAGNALFGSSKPVSPQAWKAGDPVPAGYKEQRNKSTGQRRIVPAGP